MANKKVIDAEDFTQALIKVLSRFEMSVEQLKEDTLNNKSIQFPAGFFGQVGKQIGKDGKQCKTYYHNTWKRRFYDDINEHRADIKIIVKENIAKEIDDIIAIIKKKYSSLAINHRALYQMVHVIHGQQAKQLKKQGVDVKKLKQQLKELYYKKVDYTATKSNKDFIQQNCEVSDDQLKDFCEDSEE